MRVDPKDSHILLKETYCKFHQLLCLLILGYKKSLEKLKAARDLKVAPTLSDLKPMVHNIMGYLMLLRPLAYSNAIVKHFEVTAQHHQSFALTGRGMGAGPANAVEDNMQETVEKGTGEYDDSDDGDDKGLDLFLIDNDDADDDGDAADDSDAGDDDDMDDEDDEDDEDTDILDVNQALLSDSYTIWLKLQVTHFDAVRTLGKLPRNFSKITVKLLSTPPVDQKRSPWEDVVREIMSSLVLSPLGAKKDVAEVIQTLKDMAQDNSDFCMGLDKYSKCRVCEAGTHCEANIVSMMFASEKDLQSSGNKVKFTWKEIEVSHLLLLISAYLSDVL